MADTFGPSRTAKSSTPAKYATSALLVSTSVLTYINTKRQKTQMLAEVQKKARMAADQLISTRKIIAEKQKAINTDSKGNFEFKGVIPAVLGGEIAEHFSQTTIFKMKQTSIKYRNPSNKPDAWEIHQLERFERDPDLRDISEITKLENGTEVYRLMVPLKIEEACLKCHGDPANEFHRGRQRPGGQANGELQTGRYSWRDKRNCTDGSRKYSNCLE